MHPDRDTLSNVPRSGYITARDHSFLFREWTQQRKHEAKKQLFLQLSQKFHEEKQQQGEEKDADNWYKESTL